MDCQIIAWRSQNFEPPILKSDLSNEVSRKSSIGHFDEMRICISEFWDDLISRPISDSTKTYQKHCPKTMGGEIRRCSEILATNHTFRFQNPRFSGSKTTKNPVSSLLLSAQLPCHWQAGRLQQFLTLPINLTWPEAYQPININLSTSPKKNHDFSFYIS